MPDSARDAARTLELILRAAAAEERLLARRLDQVADAHRRARAEIERELRREHFGQSPNGNGAAPDGFPDDNGHP
jgi:hypothetical protein